MPYGHCGDAGIFNCALGNFFFQITQARQDIFALPGSDCSAAHQKENISLD